MCIRDRKGSMVQRCHCQRSAGAADCDVAQRAAKHPGSAAWSEFDSWSRSPVAQHAAAPLSCGARGRSTPAQQHCFQGVRSTLVSGCPAM
eukprot:751360-Alexandrium_andersonii.AAC.1